MKRLILILILLCFGCRKEISKKEVLQKKHLDNIFNLSSDEKIISDKNINLATYKDSLYINANAIKDTLDEISGFIIVVNNKQKLRIKSNWILNDEKGFAKDFRFLSGNLNSLVKVNKNLFLLKIKDRYHNGTICNGVVEHIFSYSNNQLKYIGYIELLTYLPFNNEYLIRAIDDSKKLIHIYKFKTIKEKFKKPIGTYSFTINKDTIIFKEIYKDKSIPRETKLINSGCLE